jgi:protein-tyrosine phosphatase
MMVLQGVDNFRDFGGFSGRYGAVPKGRLFRSAHLGSATDADLTALDRLGLAAIVDLRRPTERD